MRNSSRSTSMASAEIYRFSTEEAIAFIVIASIASGIEESSSRGERGMELMCWMATDTGVSPSKGSRPVIIS